MIKRGKKGFLFNKKRIALSEISLIFLSVFTFAMLTGNFGIVSADSATLAPASGHTPTDLPQSVKKQIIDSQSPIIGIDVAIKDPNSPYVGKVGQIDSNSITDDGKYSVKIEGQSVQLSRDQFVPFDSSKGTAETNEIELPNSNDPPWLQSFYESTAGSAGTTQAIKIGEKDIQGKLWGTNGEEGAWFKSDDGNIYKFTGSAWVQQGSSYGYEVPVFGYNIQNFAVGHLAEGLVWAGSVILAIHAFGALAGVDEEDLKLADVVIGSGILSGKLAYGLFGAPTGQEGGQGIFLPKGYTGISSGQATLIGVGVAAIVFVALYEDEKERKQIVTFQCMPFEPILGGAKCEQCNEDVFRPCSQYRCKALGQACELLNEGTGKELCAWIGKNDVTSPVIKPYQDALYPEDLQYTNDQTRPPSRGVKITRNNGCLKAFTPLEFGITVDEPAQCKIDLVHTNKYEEMKYYFGGSNYYAYNHTQTMSLPNTVSSSTPTTNSSSSSGTNGTLFTSNTITDSSGATLTFPYDGEYTLYVRCRDGNGNENVDEYAISFCVDASPDTTPPYIDSTSIKSGSAVNYNADSVYIEAYVNEPAECKWSRTSKPYDDMENQMSCNTGTQQVNSDLLYTCSADLTGIKNKEENKFYFRCKDNPGSAEGDRNVMTQSYELILRGTEPLNIIDVVPNGTITGSTTTVTVDLGLETSNGADEGKALCYFSSTGDSNSYVEFYESDNYVHKQSLDLTAGSYNYYFRCIDSGGNLATNNTEFTINIDKSAPKVTRAYREGSLKIVTDEEAECSYSLNSCNFNFDEGVKLVYSNPTIQTSHFAEWISNNVYYIKCQDQYGNEPDPDKCSVIVSAVELNREIVEQ